MPRLRGCLWLTAGLVVALLAGAVAFVILRNAALSSAAGAAAPAATESVVVAARPVALRSVLVAEDLAQANLPADAIPETAVRDPNLAVGKITLADLYAGEIVVADRLLDPNVTSADGRMALVLAADQVLMAFPAVDLMSRVGILKPGDHVDLLFTLSFPVSSAAPAQPAPGEEGAQAPTTAEAQEKQATFALLQNVSIAAVVAQGGGGQGASGIPEALLLTVSPQDALTLKYAQDAGGIVDIVLRPPGVEAPFDTRAVDVDYVIDRYRISTTRRR